MNAIRHSPVMRAATSLSLIAIGIALLVALREIDSPTDYPPLALHGALDVAGHLATALIIAVAVRALRLAIPVWSLLLGGIVLDFGHVLTDLDVLERLQGSSRNGSHSLAVVATLAVVGLIDRRRANIWLGIAMGATSHLWRDMGTGTVALLWPLTETVYGTEFKRYLAVLAGVALAMIGTATLLSVHAHAVARDQTSPPPSASLSDGWREPERP